LARAIEKRSDEGRRLLKTWQQIGKNMGGSSYMGFQAIPSPRGERQSVSVILGPQREEGIPAGRLRKTAHLQTKFKGSGIFRITNGNHIESATTRSREGGAGGRGPVCFGGNGSRKKQILSSHRERQRDPVRKKLATSRKPLS